MQPATPATNPFTAAATAASSPDDPFAASLALPPAAAATPASPEPVDALALMEETGQSATFPEGGRLFRARTIRNAEGMLPTVLPTLDQPPRVVLPPVGTGTQHASMAVRDEALAQMGRDALAYTRHVL